MAEHVEVNYDTLAAIKNSFDQQAQEIQQMTQKMESQIEGLRAGSWIGQGADAFYDEMDNEVMPALLRCKNAMYEGAMVVSEIIEEFKNAEEETKNVWVPY
jgi:WXG100 family type VII secretion target